MNMTKIKIKTTQLLITFSLLLAFTSCVSKKNIVYFQNDEIDQANVNNSYKTIIKPDDLLQITITALDSEAVKPFNLEAINYSLGNSTVIGQPQLQSYLVDNKGEIDFPVLGKLKVGGLSRNEVIDILKNKLDPEYIKQPTINIRLTNFKVTVLGGVARPGSFTIPNERITILEAIGLAGDLRISAQRDNVLVQREENGKKIQYRLNLLSNKINTSPVFYLQQNDVVYVEPNYASVQSASSNTNTNLFISITGLLITIAALLTR